MLVNQNFDLISWTLHEIYQNKEKLEKVWDWFVKIAVQNTITYLLPARLFIDI